MLASAHMARDTSDIFPPESTYMINILSDLIGMLAPGNRLCLLPITRVHVEEARWLTQDIAIFPPKAIDPAWLRVVEWPARQFAATIGQMRMEGSDRPTAMAFEGDALHWVKSAVTQIDLPDFFGCTLLAFPIALDWDAFLLPPSHEHHLDILRGAMERVESVLDVVRFELCNLWTPQLLPGRAGVVGTTGFSAGLFYAPEDHESYIVAGEVVTHQIVAGVGLEIGGSYAARTPVPGELGAIAAHALRLHTDALEAATETSRFVQMMSLIEFLADPNRFLSMKEAKRLIARQVARDRTDYDMILGDFMYLTSEGGSGNGPKQGLRHNIVHVGKRLEDLTTRDERVALFRRLARYAGVPIAQMLEQPEKDWSAIEALRIRRSRELDLAH